MNTFMDEWQEANSSTDEAWDGLKTIEGQYINKKTNVGPNSSNMYVLNVNGKSVGVWGSTVIDSKFESVPVGVIVKIEPQGLAKGKSGKEYKDYKVFFKAAPFQEAKTISAADDLPPVDQIEEPLDLDL